MNMDPVLMFALGEIIVIGIVAWVLSKTSATVRPENKMIHFGAVTLIGIALLLALSMAMYYFSPAVEVSIPKGKEIFDKLVTVLSPIVTLILGYYFGTKKAKDSNV